MQRSLLVYDGSNALFRVAAAAVTGRFEDVEAVPWGAEPVVDGARWAYSAVAGPFTEAVHGRRAADLHGTFDLVPEAAAHLEGLRRVHEVPVREP